MTIRICVSVLPSTVSESLELVEKAENSKADLIEVRLDGFKGDFKLADITDSSRLPLIATNRSEACGGRFNGDEIKRKQLLLNAAGDGFDYVDIELPTSGLKDFVSSLKEIGTKSIISFHDFNKTPPFSKMTKILEKEIRSGADICKIITTAKVVDDNLITLSFVREASRKAMIVCFPMGELGKTARLLSPVFGGFFTLASLMSGRETAPGQIAIQEMRWAYQALGFI